MSSTTQRYEGEQGRRYHEAKRAIPDAAFPWVARLRAEKFAAQVQAGDVVFEYGVGYGWNLAAIECRRRIGFDVATFLALTAQVHGIEFVAETRSLAAGLADVVICHHTLEHVLAPPDVLVEIRRLLRPGGTLLLFVPFEQERRYRRFERAEPNHHLYSWNVQTLGNLVTEIGLDLREAGIGRFGYDRFAAVWACRLRLGETGFRFLRGFAHALRPGCEVRLVAAKPAGP
jgi:SAM-dependent methyltransferase